MTSDQETPQDLLLWVVQSCEAFKQQYDRLPRFLILGPAWARCMRRQVGAPCYVHYIDAFETAAWFWGFINSIPIYSLDDGAPR